MNIILYIVSALLFFDFLMLIWSLLEYCSACLFNKNLIREIRNNSENTGKETVLLLHGYGDMPRQFMQLCRELEEYGIDYVAPVLPGQNRKTLSYLRGKYKPEYYLDYLGIYTEEIKARSGKYPVIIGFSMGGTLATALGERGSADRLVLISPFFGLPKLNGFYRLLGKFFVYIIPVIPKTKKGNLNDPDGYKMYHPGSYLQSIAAYNKLQKLAGATADKIESLKIPALVFASSGDETASFEITRELFKEHPNTKLVEYSRSNHILLWDYDRGDVTRRIIEFIKKPAVR